MRHCGREADRKERAYESANRALRSDCKKELSPAFLESIRAGLSDQQKNLFGSGLAETCAPSSVERGGKVLEQEVIGHLRRREACGQSVREAVVGAFSDALSNRKASQLRAMEGHWMNKSGSSASPAVKAAKDALEKVSTADLARQIVDGSMESPKSTKRKIDLDENLLGGNG